MVDLTKYRQLIDKSFVSKFGKVSKRDKKNDNRNSVVV